MVAKSDHPHEPGFSSGGEAHELFEGILRLSVDSPGVDSNGLEAVNAGKDADDLLRSRFLEVVHSRSGRTFVNSKLTKIRLLEKTPENSFTSGGTVMSVCLHTL